MVTYDTMVTRLEIESERSDDQTTSYHNTQHTPYTYSLVRVCVCVLHITIDNEALIYNIIVYN